MTDQAESDRPMRARNFVAAFRQTPSKDAILDGIFAGVAGAGWHRSTDGRLEVAFAPRDLDAAPGGTRPDGTIRLVLGDDAELDLGVQGRCMGHGAFVETDVARGILNVKTSVVGLPPFFLYSDAQLSVLSSDLYLLPRISGVELHFDPQSVQEFARIGQPVAGRTLFREVSRLPGGCSFNLGSGLELRQHSSWTFECGEELTDWGAYVELQAGALRRAMESIDVSRSFLSLTAGLDTRAIMALLVARNKKVPTYTLSGKTPTLDARTARALSAECGFPHKTILLDDDFFRALPDLLTEASRLSGGLTSVDQAHEVLLYRSIDGQEEARLSGNLGNQVGRRGVERVSMRNADVSMLGDWARLNGNRVATWYDAQTSRDGAPDFEFLIRDEVPSSSVANYCIGSHFAIQQSPYADSRLIDNVRFMPRTQQPGRLSRWQLRLRDLRHRFLGQSSDQSFQVRVIRDTGGVLASYPINWGWRAAGGVSLGGLGLGVLALVDAALPSHADGPGWRGKLFAGLGVAGLHEYKHTEHWLRIHLKDFVLDTVHSEVVRNSGLFDSARLESVLREYYDTGRDGAKHVVVALDLALAGILFKAGV